MFSSAFVSSCQQLSLTLTFRTGVELDYYQVKTKDEG